MGKQKLPHLTIKGWLIMAKRLEHIEAAKAEAIKLGAVLELECGGKHIKGVICYNGKRRVTSFSQSPSRLACYQTVRYVRKAVKEMQG